MASVIAAACGSCGTKHHLAPTDIALLVCVDDPERSVYRFTCPLCGLQEQPASDATVSLLVNAGVVRRLWSSTATPPSVMLPLTADVLVESPYDWDAELEGLVA